MSSRMSEPVVRRPNLPLTARDEASLVLLRESAVHRRALHRVSPFSADPDEAVGESVLLHAVFQAGLAAIRAAAEDEGYRLLAEQYAGKSRQRKRVARRRKPAWADEP